VAANRRISLLGRNSDFRSTEQALDPDKNEALGMNGQIGNTACDSPKALTRVTRREWFKTAAGGCAGLALGGLVDMAAVQTQTQKLKLSDVNEFTTSCNFCSCGCGMVASVRDGKLVSMEGDFDHIVNRGSLCVKGISMFATHSSPNRLTTPRYRAPGSDHWEDISWDDAIARVAQKIRKTRDATWIATEKVGDKEVPVNRTDAIGFLGGAQNTNEECYLFQKAARLLGLAYVEHQARL
jgi:formate dehydrogenase major subunit